MSIVSPEVTSGVLTALSVGGLWFGTWLSRREKKEDTRISERSQAFEEILALNKTNAAEIARLIAERDAANERAERVATSWETRWDRQMERCRQITAPLVETIAALRLKPDEVSQVHADAVLRTLAEHNERDHSPDAEE